MLKRRWPPQGKAVTLWFEEQPILAHEGESVAAALLAAGVDYLRSAPVSGTARAPYCWMGVCFDCLLEIDGQPNQQSCLIAVQDEMRIHRQPSSMGEPS